MIDAFSSGQIRLVNVTCVSMDAALKFSTCWVDSRKKRGLGFQFRNIFNLVASCNLYSCGPKTLTLTMAHGSLYLPTSSSRASSKSWSTSTRILAILACLGVTAILGSWPFRAPSALNGKSAIVEVIKGQQCAQAKPRMPKGYNVSKILEEKERIIELLSGAVS